MNDFVNWLMELGAFVALSLVVWVMGGPENE